MTQETITAEVTPDTLPPPTVTDEAVTTSTEDVTASPSETVTEPVEKAQPAWASVTDAYELLDLEEVRAIRERDDRRRDEDQRAVFDKEYEQKHRDWESTNLNRTVQSAFGRVLEKLADGDIDGFDKAIDRVETLVQPYLEDTRNQAIREGAVAAAGDFKRLFRAGLDRKASDELDDMMGKPSTTWQDLFDFREKAKIERATAPLKSKLAEAEAEIERLKVGDRTGKGPPLGGTAGGGGRPTVQQYNEATREQREEWRKAGIEPQV